MICMIAVCQIFFKDLELQIDTDGKSFGPDQDG